MDRSDDDDLAEIDTTSEDYARYKVGSEPAELVDPQAHRPFRLGSGSPKQLIIEDSRVEAPKPTYSQGQDRRLKRPERTQRQERWERDLRTVEG